MQSNNNYVQLYRTIKKKIKINLTVIWTNYNKCNGYFLDYFEPIQNVIIKEYKMNNTNRINDIKCNKNSPILSIKEIIKKFQQEENFERGYDSHPSFNPDKIFIYNLLQLKEEIKKKIRKNIEKKKSVDFISVHIRRTDLNILHQIEKSINTRDEEFIDFINQYPDLDVYLATDNKQTQEKFIQLFPKRIIYNKLINDIKKNLLLPNEKPVQKMQ